MFRPEAKVRGVPVDRTPWWCRPSAKTGSEVLSGSAGLEDPRGDRREDPCSPCLQISEGGPRGV